MRKNNLAKCAVVFASGVFALVSVFASAGSASAATTYTHLSNNTSYRVNISHNKETRTYTSDRDNPMGKFLADRNYFRNNDLYVPRSYDRKSYFPDYTYAKKIEFVDRDKPLRTLYINNHVSDSLHVDVIIIYVSDDFFNQLCNRVYFGNIIDLNLDAMNHQIYFNGPSGRVLTGDYRMETR